MKVGDFEALTSVKHKVLIRSQNLEFQYQLAYFFIYIVCALNGEYRPKDGRSKRVESPLKRGSR